MVLGALADFPAAYHDRQGLSYFGFHFWLLFHQLSLIGQLNHFPVSKCGRLIHSSVPLIKLFHRAGQKLPELMFFSSSQIQCPSKCPLWIYTHFLCCSILWGLILYSFHPSSQWASWTFCHAWQVLETCVLSEGKENPWDDVVSFSHCISLFSKNFPWSVKSYLIPEEIKCHLTEMFI